MTPPAERTGSASTAAGAPTLAWSKSSKPASRHEQSQSPSQWRIGQRYSYGAGMVGAVRREDLTGGEVEPPAAVLELEERAGRGFDDAGRKLPAVADQE